MTTKLAITLDEDQQHRLEALAAERRETPAEIASEAVAQYLAEDAAFRRAVGEGLLAINAGEVVDYRPFIDGLRRRMAAREAESDR